MDKRKIAALILSFFLLVAAATAFLINKVPDPREKIVISIPHSRYIRNIDSNYYKAWLEEQTGLSIQFNIVYEPLTADYLRSAFASGYAHSDAFFSILSGEDLAGCNQVLQEFGESGHIIPLNEYVEQSTHLNAIFETYPNDDLRRAITSPDGNIYYMPGFDSSISERNFQVLWLNQSWMKKLGLGIPQTTDELREVLRAFKTGDPNGNGRQDEIPLSGSNDIANEQCYNFIINAFVYNDPANARLFIDNRNVRFAPMTDEWREAMQYLRGLYAEGLISPFQFDLSHRGLTALANDPWDILGGFTSASVTDVIFPGNIEIANSFTHVAPVAGPDGTRRATVRTPLPKPGGIVSASCENPEAVFKLFDLMMSEKAFLIGRYGEENVDWLPGDFADIDFYGNSATVRVINQLRNRIQNKTLCEYGPFYGYPAYADGVTFSVRDVDPQYIDARAYRAYWQYMPREYIRSLTFDGTQDIQALRQEIDAYTDESIRAFITGEADPFNDRDWAAHIEKYQELGIERLIEAAMEVLS